MVEEAQKEHEDHEETAEEAFERMKLDLQVRLSDAGMRRRELQAAAKQAKKAEDVIAEQLEELSRT